MAERIVWTSGDGATTIDLTDEAAGYTVNAAGTAGLRSVGYELTTTRYAGIDGETVNAIHATPNEPTLGLLVEADGEADLRTKIRGLVRTMRPKAGPGTLTVSNETGESRSLTCYCTDGLPGQEDTNSILDGAWWRAALQFYAPDPWWLGDEQTVSIGLGAPTNFFPFFPLVLASSTVQGRFAVDLSDSDTPAFPVWTITGPGSSLVLTNNTTGRSLTVGASLASGETMVVDTRRGYQSVRRGDGTNLLGSVDGYPDLWSLAESVNSITAALNGATSNSRIVGSWQPRYAGI
jgi:hypothetical protein